MQIFLLAPGTYRIEIGFDTQTVFLVDSRREHKSFFPDF
jgi:hypothetical protein